jgi:hypothetical protein
VKDGSTYIKQIFQKKSKNCCLGIMDEQRAWRDLHPTAIVIGYSSKVYEMLLDTRTVLLVNPQSGEKPSEWYAGTTHR